MLLFFSISDQVPMNSQSNFSKSSRPVGHIDLRKLGVPEAKIAEIASMIIGYRGNGIKRYTSTVVGSFVRLQSDLKEPDPNIKVLPNQCYIVYISGRTLQDVQKVAMMINQDILAHKNRSISSSRPSLSISCPSELVSNIIGRGGNNIKSIITLVGDGCYIIHNKNTGMFNITANTPNACVLASNMIRQTIANLESPTVITRPSLEVPPPPQKKNTMHGSRYSLLADSDNEETSSIEEDVSSTVSVSSSSSSKRTKRSPAPNIARQLFHTPSQGQTESNRKGIRMMLSKQLDKDGMPLYPDYTIWDQKQKTYVQITGPGAVPWEAVDKFISSQTSSVVSNPVQTLPTLDAFPPTSSDELTPTLTRSDAWSDSNPPNTYLWGSGNIQSVISSEGVNELNQRSVEEARSVIKKCGSSTDPWDQPCNYYDLLNEFEGAFVDYTPTNWDEGQGVNDYWDN